jgi:hypothetical protein
MKKTETKTLALAMDVLALNMPDGVTTTAITEAANRLLELDAENLRLKQAIRETPKSLDQKQLESTK